MRTILSKFRDARIQSSITIIIVLLLIFGAFTTLDFKTLKSLLYKFDLITIFQMLLLVFGNYIIRAYRFYLSARRLNVFIPFIHIFIFYIAGFAMSLTPGKLGELLRLWLIRQHYNYGIEQTLPLQISDRAMDACGCLILCLIGFSTFAGYTSFLVIVTIFLLSAVLVLMKPEILYWNLDLVYRLIGKNGRFLGKIRIFVRSLSKLFTPMFFVFALLLSCFGWSAECIALFLCCKAVGESLQLDQATFVFTFSNLAGALTFLPGGLGGTEVLMVALLKNVGMNFENAAIVTAVIRIITLWFGTLIGVIIFMWLRGTNIEMRNLDFKELSNKQLSK